MSRSLLYVWRYYTHVINLRKVEVPRMNVCAVCDEYKTSVYAILM